MIEMDEGYFTVASTEIEKLKAKRSSNGESTPLENLETGKKSNHVRYFKAKILESHSSEEIDKNLKKSLAEKTIIFSDNSTSSVDISKLVKLHVTEKSEKKTTIETLRWIHIFISNAKRNILGNYHKIKLKYLQLYLNEFAYKLNRRYFGDKLFDRVIVAAISSQ